jgi:hypothetical protein
MTGKARRRLIDRHAGVKTRLGAAAAAKRIIRQ